MVDVAAKIVMKTGKRFIVFMRRNFTLYYDLETGLYLIILR